MPTDDPADDEFERRYGPWEPLPPAEVAELLRDLDGPWWIVGGHAIEAFTGVARAHEDIDVALYQRDLPALRTILGDRFHLWSAGSATLRPLDDEHPELHAESNQVWIREHALAPWKVDFVLVDERDDGWVWNHDRSTTLPFATSTWVAADGLRYARPEIVLAYKTRVLSAKNDADFGATWPRLDEAARTWLHDTVERVRPGHPWLNRMAAPDGPVGREGTTVRLREATLADGPALDARDADPAMVGEFNDFGLPRPRPLSEQLAHGKRMVGPDRGRLLIERVSDGAWIGDVSWHPEMYGPGTESRALNIGISLHPEARGHGYGTEAQRLLAELLFESFDVERVEASTDIENLPEQRSLEKAGFTREGVLRRAQFRAGAYHDLVNYSMIREDLGPVSDPAPAPPDAR